MHFPDASRLSFTLELMEVEIDFAFSNLYFFTNSIAYLN